MFDSYTPPNWEERARAILFPACVNFRNFHTALKKLGFDPVNDFKEIKRERRGCADYYLLSPDGTAQTSPAFSKNLDHSITTHLPLETTLQLGGNPKLFSGVNALEFLDDKGKYKLVSTGNGTVYFRQVKQPTDNSYLAAFLHYDDFGDCVPTKMPVEVLVDFVPKDIHTVSRDHEGTAEPYVHKKGLYVRACTGPVTSKFGSAERLPEIADPKAAYEAIVGLAECSNLPHSGSNVSKLVEILKA